jgi:hypothetical protein
MTGAAALQSPPCMKLARSPSKQVKFGAGVAPPEQWPL